MTAALRAYIAKSYDGESDVLVFSRRNDMAARRQAAGQLPSGDVDDIDEMRRAPEFDQFADGRPITAKDYIERGWWFECANCSRRIDEEMDYLRGDDYVEELDDGTLIDSDGEVLEPTYHVLWPDSVWCSSGCCHDDITGRFNRRVEAQEEQLRMEGNVLRRFPAASGIKVGRRHYDKSETAYAVFCLPGFPPYCHAEIREDSDTSVYVSKPAVQAFYAYEATLLNAENRDPGDEHRAPRSRA